MFFSKKDQTKTTHTPARELLEAEREFREGLTSIKDLIAPSAMKVESTHVQVSGVYARTFFVLAYPRYLSTSWLSGIINLDQTIDIGLYIYPMESDVVMKKLRDKVGQLEASIAMDQEKGAVRDPLLETAYHDVEELRDRLQQGTERYFRMSLYFTVYAPDLPALDKISGQLESMLAAKLIVVKRSVMQAEAGFNSTLPIGTDELAVTSNMNTGPLSTTFPFVSSELTSNDGILYGINRHNNSLILFDRFQMEHANAVALAKSGSGKSYAVKLEILRSLMLGTEVIVIDPENEYKHLAETVGGSFLNVSLNSHTRINPFDLPKSLQG